MNKYVLHTGDFRSRLIRFSSMLTSVGNIIEEDGVKFKVRHVVNTPNDKSTCHTIICYKLGLLTN